MGVSGFGGVFGFGLEDDSEADDSDACDPDEIDDMIYIYIEDFMFGGHERMRKNGP
jgi:hypothetical protein